MPPNGVMPSVEIGEQTASSTTLSISSATVQESTSLRLPPVGQLYLFGLVTGGGRPTGTFTSGEYASVSNSAGYLVAALAISKSASDNYSTGSLYPTIGGAVISGFSSYTASYGSNNAPQAASASDTFSIVVPGSMVVVFALGGDEQCITVSGIPGFVIDASNSDSAGLPNAITIGHAYPAVGSYTVTEETQQCHADQTPGYAGDLIGVFVFRPSSTTSTTTTSSVSGSNLPLYGGIAAAVIALLLVLLMVTRRRVRKLPPSQPTPTARSTPAQQPRPITPEVAQKLQQLKSMLDAGLITQEDYEAQKKRLLE